MPTRLCKICSGEKPIDDSVPQGKARGFMGNVCWDCYKKSRRLDMSLPEALERRVALSTTRGEEKLAAKRLAAERGRLEEAAALELIKMEKQRAWLAVLSQVEKGEGFAARELIAWRQFCDDWGM